MSQIVDVNPEVTLVSAKRLRHPWVRLEVTRPSTNEPTPKRLINAQGVERLKWVLK